MAFWGVEVKPGRPFIHKYDDSKGRLHISTATLGFGSATTKSTLQCNVGNRSPVYLCSLYPGSTESLQLNVELEEVDEVVFTVIGPRSIHLCGYYLGKTSRRVMFDGDSSESYGEDIADTENERSDGSDEDDLEDSFIDDNPNPEVFPLSPLSNEEEASDDNKLEAKKSKRGRLRKKYYSVESDDDCDVGFEEKMIVDDSMHDQIKESDNEDSLLISSLYKFKTRQRILDDEINAGDSGAFDARNKNHEDDGDGNIQTDLETDNVLQDWQRDRETAVSDEEKDVGDVKKSKKKKEKQKKTKSSPSGQSIKLDKSEKDEPKIDKMTQDILAGQEQNKDGADDDKQTETLDKMLSISEDSLLISSIYKNKSRRKIFDEEIHKTGDSEAIDARNKNDEDGGDSIIETALETNNVHQDSQMQREAAVSDKEKDVGAVKKSKKKKKEKQKETKSSPNGRNIKLDESEKEEPKIDKMTQDVLAGQEQNKDGADDGKQTETVDKMLSLSEDSPLIYKNKSRRKIFDEEIHKTGKAFDAWNKNDEDGGDSIVKTALETNNVLQDSQMHREAALSDKKKDVGDVKKSKKKKKEKETKSSPNGHSIKLDKSEQDKPKIEVTLDILAGQEQIKDSANDDKQTETADKNLPSSEAVHVQDEKPKKKRKERQKEHLKQPTDNEDVGTVAVVPLPAFVEDAGKAKTKRRKKEQINKGSHLEGESSVEHGVHDFSNGNQNEEKVKKGKSKSKSKREGNIEA